MEFKDRLIARRNELGLTVAVAAARAGVEGPNYRAWEAGRRTPPPERQAVILSALAVASGGKPGDFRDGALWALAAMHETLARCYRELSVVPPSIGPRAVTPADAARYEDALRIADPARLQDAAAPPRARKRK